MKSDIECLHCILKQALNATRHVTSDQNIQRNVIDKLAKQIPTFNLEDNPAILSKNAYEVVSDMTGVMDPFRQTKRQTNEDALKLLPFLHKVIKNSKDPIDSAIHLSVAGNIIDLGIGQVFDIEKDVLTILKSEFKINHSHIFKKEIIPGRKLLYLGDNSGEIVFDRVLIEELLKKGIEITFSVKSGPIINDVMMEDAKMVGLTEIVPVIETGSNDIGVDLNNVNDEFREVFKNADFIIAKGHGNFEMCNELPYNIYFLLKAKCWVVANELGVENGDIVFKHQNK